MDKPLPGTKIAEKMFTRPEGATMDEIIAATGGPQYNVRRRLKAKGYVFREIKEGSITRYYATPPGKPSYELTISPRGQVVLPKDVRERLGFKAGGKVQAELDGDRLVIARRTKTIADLFGILHRPGMRARTVEEMDEGIAGAVAERNLRSLGRQK